MEASTTNSFIDQSNVCHSALQAGYYSLCSSKSLLMMHDLNPRIACRLEYIVAAAWKMHTQLQTMSGASHGVKSEVQNMRVVIQFREELLGLSNAFLERTRSHLNCTFTNIPALDTEVCASADGSLFSFFLFIMSNADTSDINQLAYLPKSVQRITQSVTVD